MMFKHVDSESKFLKALMMMNLMTKQITDYIASEDG
jgi:hypothetical protein